MSTHPAVAPPAPALLARELGALIRPWRARIAGVLICVLGAAALNLVPALVLRHIIDTGLTPAGNAGLGPAACLYLGALVGAALLTSGYGYLAATLAQLSLAELRGQLFEHLLRLPTAYHDRTPIGDSISRTTADVETIGNLFSSSVPTLIGQTAGLSAAVATMLALSPVLTGAVIITIPPIVLLTRQFRRKVRDAERATRKAVGLANSQLAEDLSAVDVIRGFGREALFANRFRLVLLQWLQAANRSVLYSAFYAPMLATLAAVATASLLWLGTRNAFDAFGVSVGTLTAFVVLFAQFFTPLVNLGEEWQNVQGALAGAERVFAVLRLPPDQPPPGSGPPPTLPEGDMALAVNDVTFGYSACQSVLHHVTLTVRAGEHVAVIGRTGAGKSSLLSLLAGLYRPWSGHITLAGSDPCSLDDTGRRAVLGYVPQNVTLFPGTIAENITLEDPSITLHDILLAAQLAGADSFINTLPQGSATIISDTGHGNGVQLSAGQRQLLALARAMVARPNVLLLDEATAVVDGASDSAFREALRTRVIPTGTAVLTVAHRLVTAREADRVIVIDAGRIIEQGTPSELLAAGGRFADLVTLEEAGWDWREQPDR
ncbi:ABC transporter related (plasmid) [Arthrobacter sp. FB24]|uniref:ABC transporter ATP-binding protein n=1 Tax=Arthrobacter sp. (strain FB24) TaxID=290399 RepID=UPI00005279CD|nr:ABC transporter ATP-binding protein [Arthrobacter sp. FB24]ABK05898.1 ABC transporter related [Arthrobacter sp. FB24]